MKRLVLSEENVSEFVSALSDCIVFQDGGIAHLEVCERGGEKDVTSFTIQLWSNAVNETQGMMFENSGKLDISWMPVAVINDMPVEVEKQVVGNNDVVITQSYEKMSVKELKALCQKHGIKGISAMRKAELIKALICALPPAQ